MKKTMVIDDFIKMAKEDIDTAADYEMESDNYSYFLIKGILLIGLILSFMPVYEIILSAFIPSVQIPFYH